MTPPPIDPLLREQDAIRAERWSAAPPPGIDPLPPWQQAPAAGTFECHRDVPEGDRVVRDANAIVFALVARDGAVCYLCGQGPEPENPWEIEHRKPRAAGGEGDLVDLSNLALAHRSCNRIKGTSAVVS